MKISKKEVLLFGLIVLVFLVLRIPAINHSYHQDEYKWSFVLDASSEYFEPGRIPHPPISEFSYRYGGELVGFENLRIIPLAVSLANLLLIFYLAKTIFDKKTAFWTAGLFTISAFSVLASLMIDTDGAIMPFFFLVSLISYTRLKNKNFEVQFSNFKESFWLLLLVVGMVGGFLVKVSFIISIAALVLDFMIEKRIFSNKKFFLRFLMAGATAAAFLVGILLVSKSLFPSFNFQYALHYWETFVNFSNRNWLQIFIQFAKALLFVSPLLLLPVVFIDREIFRKTRPLFIFIFIALFFYLVAFDFSIGALDRYLQLLIIPLCIISGAVFVKYLNGRSGFSNYVMPIILGLLIFSIQFFSPVITPLYPKAEWISRVVSLKWNFLFPFFGGSGPTPFYVSLAFIGLSWVIGLAFILVAFYKKEFRKRALVSLFVVGFMYNIVFVEEYVWGKINGSSSTLIKNAAAFIKENKNIQKVTVYNDNGGGDIVRIDKYRKRLYVDPKFDVNEKIINLNRYKEHYLVVNIPLLDPASVYARYLNSCEVIYEEWSGQIPALIYDCQNAPDINI